MYNWYLLTFCEQKNMFELWPNQERCICRENVAVWDFRENYITVALNSFHLVSLMQNWFGAAEHLTTSGCSQGVWSIFLSPHNLSFGDCFCEQQRILLCLMLSLKDSIKISVELPFSKDNFTNGLWRLFFVNEYLRIWKKIDYLRDNWRFARIFRECKSAKSIFIISEW